MNSNFKCPIQGNSTATQDSSDDELILANMKLCGSFDIAPIPDIPLGGFIHKYVPLFLNEVSAPFFKKEIEASAYRLNGFSKTLTRMVEKNGHSSPSLIPRVLHFVSLSKTPQPLPFFVRMAIASALHHNPNWKAILHCSHEPLGQQWHIIKHRLHLNLVPDFDYFGVAPLRHYAHKADVIRALVLKEIGGAYLDLDTLTLQSFEPLRNNKFVMGMQPSLPGQSGGLCNAIMFGQAGSQFLELWLHEFRSFRSRGTDWLWDFISVKTPALLARKHPALITCLRPEALFQPLWDKVEEQLFAENRDMSLPNFAVHLWSNSIKDRLETLDEYYVRHSNSLYASLARPVLEAGG